jgi:hypothetical protein
MPLTVRDLPVPVVREPSPAWIGNAVRGLLDDSCAWLDEIGMTGLYTGDGDLPERAIKRFMQAKPSTQGAVTEAATDAIPYTFWLEHREIYTMDPQMSRDLAKLRSTAKIPAQVFERLVHPNPLFVLPAALPLTHMDGAPGRIVAFLITGCVSPSYPIPSGVRAPLMRLGNNERGGITVSTHPFREVNALHVAALCEVHTADGALVDDFQWLHFTLPTHGEFVLEDLAREALKDIDGRGGLDWLPADALGEKHIKRREEFTLQVARVVVSHLLYACSRKAEIGKGRSDRPPAPRGKKGKKTAKPSGTAAATVHTVGYRTGAAIQDTLRRIGEARSTGTPTGKTLPPHTRGSHLHMYLVGPGRKEIDFILLDPIRVNAHLDDGHTATTHEVR